ncbi:hypothetical protein E1B28_000223 [Marasmius oreades]|uniref:O-methyltransferase dimerisation domain-containing protein n=1 Tax=Marasmius oreades TaxID=181124 RepID=A0A9P8ADX5_9AGAR|nr:uncharacterized protein E1B28_000223 [Marasmius oreades]KAG7098261.1 hypothetical protein E1B28_000223 [Marasmius oreades]
MWDAMGEGVDVRDREVDGIRDAGDWTPHHCPSSLSPSTPYTSPSLTSYMSPSLLPLTSYMSSSLPSMMWMASRTSGVERAPSSAVVLYILIDHLTENLCCEDCVPLHSTLSCSQRAFQYSEPAGIRAVVTLKIPDLLLDEPQGLHVSEIAQQANVNQGKLARIMRLLATKRCFREVKPDVFVNNRLSIQLLSTNGLSDLALHIDETRESRSRSRVTDVTVLGSVLRLTYYHRVVQRSTFFNIQLQRVSMPG